MKCVLSLPSAVYACSNAISFLSPMSSLWHNIRNSNPGDAVQTMSMGIWKMPWEGSHVEAAFPGDNGLSGNVFPAQYSISLRHWADHNSP